jgi:hypothetical protein
VSSKFLGAQFLGADVFSAELLYLRWHGARVVP